MKKGNAGNPTKTSTSGSSALVQSVLKRKALVQQGKVSASDAAQVAKQAWKDLCTGLGLSLKEFSACRSLVDACMSKWPEVVPVVTDSIFEDLTTAADAEDIRLFSRTLLAALDCESTKKCVRQVMSSHAALDVESRPWFLLTAIQKVLRQLERRLSEGHRQEVTRDSLETERDAERCFDCVGRVISFLTVRGESLDIVLKEIRSSTEGIIVSVGKNGDIHLLRSASLSLHHVNASFQSPSSLRSILFEGPLSVSSSSSLSIITRSALLLGALSCAANNPEVDTESMLADLLKTIENCLSTSTEDDQTSSSSSSPSTEQGEEERFEKITLACEALCAWSTKVKSCMNCTADLVERAIQVVIVYMDHRESSVGTICATAFERLIETCLRVIDGEQVLSRVFLEQMAHVSSPDFASARRGLYPMMEKLVQVLGAKRVNELHPGFVSTVMNSAFRRDDSTSVRPELGNGICNLVVCFCRSWMCELDFKVSRELKAELGIITDVLRRGPDDLFASYFVCRRLLGDLLSEAKSVQEQEAIREVGKTLLQSLSSKTTQEVPKGQGTGSGDVVVVVKSGKSPAVKRSLEESLREGEDEPKRASTITPPSPVALLWARLNVLLALERGNTHILVLESPIDGSDDDDDDEDDDQKREARATTTIKRKHQQRTTPMDFAVEASVLRRALVHERSDVREVAWNLASTRIKRTKFPEPLLLRQVEFAFEHVLKYEGLGLKASMIRLMDRIAFCLEMNVGGDDGEEFAKIESKRFIEHCAEMVGRCIYPGAPIDRVALALEIAVHLVKTFAKNRPRLIRPLLAPGTVGSVLDTLESPFDLARVQAFEFLSAVPGALPGIETTEALERLVVDTWYPRLFSRMRRNADSAALFFRLVHSKYCVELGWKIDLLPSIVTKSKATSDLEASLKEEIRNAGDAYFMRCALEEARKCTTVPTAYDVGCVIVSSGETGERKIISTGYSREFPGNTHAEECALRKLGVDREGTTTASHNSAAVKDNDGDDCALGRAKGTTLYTTMEPCSLRLSGNRPCSSRCIAAQVKRVVVGVKEPDRFVQNCQGWIQLEERGIEVCSVKDDAVLAECALLANNNDHTVPPGFEASKRRSFDRFTKLVDLNRDLAGVYLCHQLLDVIEENVHKSKQPGRDGEEEVALHGSLMALRYALGDINVLNTSSSSTKDQPLLVALVDRTLTVLMETLNAGVATLIRLEESERLNAHQVVTEDDDFITKTMSWLTVREGSELLSETLEMVSRLVVSGGEEGSEEKIQNKCGWFLATSLSLRHLGAMTYVTKGLERISKLLLLSDSLALQRVPTQQFLQELFQKLGKEEFDRALRRTEGFSLSFRAILRAAQTSNRADLVHSTLRELLKIAATYTDSPRHQIAALNVLCILFEDAMLAKSVMPFVSTALELAVRGFRHQMWGIRNSSLNVFVALIKRSVGEPDQAMGGDEEAREMRELTAENSAAATTRTKSHSTTAKLFFNTHPKLLPFLLGELIEATKAQEEGGKEHPSLHPVLLFLSSLRRSSLAKNDPALDFVPHVQRVAFEHPVYFIRSTAVRALVVLTPREQAPFQAMLRILTNHSCDDDDRASPSSNARHGVLMTLQQWAKTAGGFEGLRDHHEKELVEIRSVLAEAYIANPSECNLLREAALDAFSRLFSPSETFELVKRVWNEFGQSLGDEESSSESGGDGAQVGRTRFRVKLMRLFVRYAVVFKDWPSVTAFLSLGSKLSHVHLALEDMAIHLKSGIDDDDLNSIVMGLMNLLNAKPKRNELAYHLGALEAVVQNAASFPLAPDHLDKIQQVSRSEGISLKARAACTKIVSLAFASSSKSSISTTQAKVFVENLEQDTDPDAALELRLASAEALLNGCLVMRGEDESLALRCWVRCLHLLQDDDREVCDIARRAVLKSLKGREDLCLDLTFQKAWAAITDRFWANPLWQVYLLEWIFNDLEAVVDRRDGCTQDDLADPLAEDDSDSVLFKTDNVNQFFESTYFSAMAGKELVRVRRLRITANTETVHEYRVIAQRVRHLLQGLVKVINPSLDPKDGFNAGFSALVAAQALGVDGLTDAYCTLREVLAARCMPLMMLRKAEDCDRRLFG